MKVLTGVRRPVQAFETRSQRGMKRLQADPMFPASGHRVEGGAPANGNAKTATV